MSIDWSPGYLESQLEVPFSAYRGDQPYIFVCYSHEDSAAVYPELGRLREAGINVYYDEGIAPGHEWTQELADAIDGCSRFLFFVSTASVASRHCRNEVQYALDQGKSLVAVHLAPTALPGGLRLSIGSAQAILKHELRTDVYQRKLLQAIGVPDHPHWQHTPEDAERGGPLKTRERAPLKTRVRAFGWMAAASLVAASGLALWLLTEPISQAPRQEAPGASAAPERSIAMSSFTMVDRDATLETHAQALLEEIRTVVATNPELRTVAAPNGGSERQNVEETAYVFGGSLQRIDENMRLRARLTRTNDRNTVWAKTFEYSAAGGVPAIAETATTIARFIRQELVMDQLCESVRQTTHSQEAADAYCAAVAESYRGAQIGATDPQLALNRALRAVRLDPGIVDAYFQVGLNYYALVALQQMDWREAAREARAALDRMQALAPDAPQTLGLQGRIQQLEMNYPGASASYRESLARDPLEPRAVTNHVRLGDIAVSQGRLGDGLEHYQRALRVDDSNAWTWMAYAHALWSDGENREAIQAADAGLDLVDSGPAHVLLLGTRVTARSALGETAQANAILDAALSSVESSWKPALAAPLGYLGRTEEALRLLEALEQSDQSAISLLAVGYAALGEERAFEWIQKAIDKHILYVASGLRTSPFYSKLREHPRWGEVMAELEAEEAEGRAGSNKQG